MRVSSGETGKGEAWGNVDEHSISGSFPGKENRNKATAEEDLGSAIIFKVGEVIACVCSDWKYLAEEESLMGQKMEGESRVMS